MAALIRLFKSKSRLLLVTVIRLVSNSKEVSLVFEIDRFVSAVTCSSAFVERQESQEVIAAALMRLLES